MSHETSLQQFESLYPLPGIALWKKNIDSVLVDVNQEYARIYGFNSPQDAIGKTDYDIPCGIAELAHYFRENDRKILSALKPAKFLCILKTANGEWKVFLVVKSIYYLNNKAEGTAAYSVELPNLFLKLGKNPVTAKNSTSAIAQVSYTIRPNIIQLTNKESECLFFLMRGKSAKETAIILNISPRTVEKHIESIKYKFNCRTKLELIAYAIENNYLNIIPESLLQQQVLISLE